MNKIYACSNCGVSLTNRNDWCDTERDIYREKLIKTELHCEFIRIKDYD